LSNGNGKVGKNPFFSRYRCQLAEWRCTNFDFDPWLPSKCLSSKRLENMLFHLEGKATKTTLPFAFPGSVTFDLTTSLKMSLKAHAMGVRGFRLVMGFQ
jgi:hypothetical protein